MLMLMRRCVDALRLRLRLRLETDKNMPLVGDFII